MARTLHPTVSAGIHSLFFALNCAVVAQQIREGRDSWIPQIDYLLTRLRSHTQSDGFVLYIFDLALWDNTIPANWNSAFAQEMAALGLLELHDATKDPAHPALARIYLKHLKWNGQDTPIVRVDANNYLSFEETPSIRGRATFIHNGHVSTTLALYRYQQLTGDVSFEPCLRAGRATAARYLPEARVPGAASRYGGFNDAADYGPLRTHNLVEVLAAATAIRFSAI